MNKKYLYLMLIFLVFWNYLYFYLKIEQKVKHMHIFNLYLTYFVKKIYVPGTPGFKTLQKTYPITM